MKTSTSSITFTTSKATRVGTSSRNYPRCVQLLWKRTTSSTASSKASRCAVDCRWTRPTPRSSGTAWPTRSSSCSPSTTASLSCVSPWNRVSGSTWNFLTTTPRSFSNFPASICSSFTPAEAPISRQRIHPAPSRGSLGPGEITTESVA